MNDRDALYAAILAHPDEDTPRLAYADWLEENGEAEHAAFIRKDIEEAREPWGEATLRDFLRPAEEKTHFAPPSPVESHTDYSCSVGFHRGFASEVSVQFWNPGDENWLQRLPVLFHHAPIDEFSISGERNQIPHWDEFVTNPLFAKVRKLSLSLASRNEAQMRKLIDSPHSTALRELAISVDSEGAAMAFLRSRLVKQLTALNFTFHYASGPSDAAVKKLGTVLKQSSLRRLCLYESGQIWAGVRESLPETLEELVFLTHDFGIDGIEPFARSYRGKNLRALTFTGPLSEGDMQALAACPALSGLLRLELGECRLTSRAVQALAKSPHLGNLLYLGLSGNVVGDSGAVALAKSPHLTNLLGLAARSEGYTDRTAEAMLNATFADRLIYLDLFKPGRGISPHMKRKLGKRFKNVNV